MDNSRIKKSTYGRIFGVFLAVYLILMIAFSVFLVSQEKQVVYRELGGYSAQFSNRLVEILKDNIDDNKQITDIAEVKRGFVNKSLNIFMLENHEFAVYTSDYELIYNSNDYWKCVYSESDGSSHTTRHGLLNPRDWFNEEEIKELEDYLYAEYKAEKPGDLIGYQLDMYGLWLDQEMIIPENIYITPMLASTFNDKGDVISSGGSRRHDPIYSTDYKNTEDLPYYKFGSIVPEYNNPNNEAQEKLREMVLDVSNLKRFTEDFSGSFIFNEWDNGLTYHYYMVVAYESTTNVSSDGTLYSPFWTPVAFEINIGERISSTLLYVWISCLLIFSAAAYILSKQTYKTYLKGRELERQRKEMTDALAHDLKTPLSIISGYAQNLQEDIHTEKREHYASNINSNVARMDEVIGQMLEMSRLESDSFDLRLEEISLGDLSNKIINRYKQICNDNHISLSLEGDALIKADSSLIDRLIDNFIINAIDHTPENGRISIKISNDKFEIYNSGSHIAEEIIKEIWLPYKKANQERSNTKGTGLGLSISRTILDLHKFSYGAENTEDGVTFWFKWT